MMDTKLSLFDEILKSNRELVDSTFESTIKMLEEAEKCLKRITDRSDEFYDGFEAAMELVRNLYDGVQKGRKETDENI